MSTPAERINEEIRAAARQVAVAGGTGLPGTKLPEFLSSEAHRVINADPEVFRQHVDAQRRLMKVTGAYLELKPPTLCRYCGSKVRLRAHPHVERYGPVYACRDQECGARVGTRGDNKTPVGTMARTRLRFWRRKAHRIFDRIWRDGLMSRAAAYAWLANELGLPAELTHMALFEVERCERVIELSRAYYPDKPKHQIDPLEESE